jgi:hypothetical protein
MLQQRAADIENLGTSILALFSSEMKELYVPVISLPCFLSAIICN